ncbi:MAG: hypothetical protein JKY87_08385 [Mariprofundus sp.]|nr:hypothetical protein [Mariprofundus sp.]
MKVLLAHGSPDHRHGEQIKALADTVSGLLDSEVGVAFLSDDALPLDATVLPLFLGEGKHVREDVPKLAALSGCTMLPSLSEYADQIGELVVSEMTYETRRINAMFVLYRFAGFEQLAAALYGRVKTCSKHAIASLHSEPSVSSVLKHWQGQGVTPVSLQPMLLFEGQSMDRLRRMTESFDKLSDISIAPVLSEYDGFAALVANCFRNKP